MISLKDLAARFAAPSGPHPYARPATMHVLFEFTHRLAAIEHPRILELGTGRSIAERSTMHRHYVPHAAEYLGTDLAPGPDVDIVADVHCLSAVAGVEQFDAVISCSTFEHLKYPHRAAHEVMKVLKVGGLLFIQTHQTYELHAYPADYFRYSREGLAALFGTRMGFHVLATDYEFPAGIAAREVPAMVHHEAWLNVRLVGVKTGPTPGEYVYDLDYSPAP